MIIYIRLPSGVLNLCILRGSAKYLDAIQYVKHIIQEFCIIYGILLISRIFSTKASLLYIIILLNGFENDKKAFALAINILYSSSTCTIFFSKKHPETPRSKGILCDFFHPHTSTDCLK